MKTPRTAFAAVELDDHRVAVLGGVSLQDHPQLHTNSPCMPAVEVWDPRTSTWSVASPMSRARCAHTATLLSDGRVLVAGGADKMEDFRDQIPDAEIWDPRSDTWTSAGTMASTRAGHTATVLPDGRVLVIGGDAGGYGAPTTAEVWDPKSGWKSVAAPATKFFQHRALLRSDGTVLLFGGRRSSRAGERPVEETEAWDPRTDVWRPGPDLPITNATEFVPIHDGTVLIVEPGADAGAYLWNPLDGTAEPLQWPREGTRSIVEIGDDAFWFYGYYGASLVTLGTGKVHDAGMATECCSVEKVVALDDGRVLVIFRQFAEVWSSGNTLPGEWRSAGGLLTTLRRRSALAVLREGILVTGGERSKEAQWLSIETGESSGLPAMRRPRDEHAAIALQDGSALVIGGVDDAREVRVALAHSETWDPIARRWQSAGELAVPRAGPTATLLTDGRVLAVGGWTGRQSPGAADSSLTTTAELWNPNSRKWDRTGDLLEGRYEHSATSLLDGRVLVAGGTQSQDPYSSSTAELWDSATETWTSTAAMKTARRGHLAVRLDDGRVLVVGGKRGDVRLTSTEIWDPTTGEWQVGPDAPAESVGGDLVALSGGRALFFGTVGEGCLAAVFDGVSWTARVGHGRTRCVEYAHRVSDRDVIAVTRAGCAYHFDPEGAP